MLAHAELTERIIGAAIAVHKTPDPGSGEGVCETAFAIVRTYLKVTNLEAGLLLNFATTPLTVKRVGREEAFRSSVPAPGSFAGRGLPPS